MSLRSELLGLAFVALVLWVSWMNQGRSQNELAIQQYLRGERAVFVYLGHGRFVGVQSRDFWMLPQE
jgi:hypothetical protein